MQGPLPNSRMPEAVALQTTESVYRGEPESLAEFIDNNRHLFSEDGEAIPTKPLHKEENLANNTSLSNNYITVSKDVVPSYTISALEEFFKGVQTRAHESFSSVLPVLQHLQFQKEARYGNSWKQRGEILSIFPNLCRKWDRLENIITSQIDSGLDISSGTDESKIDTVGDLANYCILYLTYLAEKDPVGYRKWVESVSKMELPDQD